MTLSCVTILKAKNGVLEISQLCKMLKCDYSFYTKNKKSFSRNIKKNYKNLISMNWHSIGKYFSSKFDNLIIVDFGSTTTDFVCIKNTEIVNDGLMIYKIIKERNVLLNNKNAFIWFAT